MLEVISSWSPRRKIAAVGVALVLLALVILLLVTAMRAHRDPAATPTPRPRAGAPSAPPITLAPALPPLPRTDDPVVYAREVATALFDVNPSTVTRPEFLQFWQAELPTVVYSDGAAKGLTLAVQNADAIGNLTSSWIPSQSAWDIEAAQHTTTRFLITSVSVPDFWMQEIAAGTFRDPGLHMERVLGVLTQTYGVGERHTLSRSVVIDLGLLCGPTQPGGCRLLAPQQASTG